MFVLVTTTYHEFTLLAIAAGTTARFSTESLLRMLPLQMRRMGTDNDQRNGKEGQLIGSWWHVGLRRVNEDTFLLQQADGDSREILISDLSGGCRGTVVLCTIVFLMDSGVFRS